MGCLGRERGTGGVGRVLGAGRGGRAVGDQRRAGITLVSSSPVGLSFPSCPPRHGRTEGTRSQTSACPSTAGCEGAFAWDQASTNTSVPSQGVALGPPVAPAQRRPPSLHPRRGAGFSTTPCLHPQGLRGNTGDAVWVVVPLTLLLLLFFFAQISPPQRGDVRSHLVRKGPSSGRGQQPGSFIRVGPAAGCQQQ